MVMNSQIKEDFRFWMRPKLKNYYEAKIEYLKKILDDIIPGHLDADFLENAVDRRLNAFSMDLMDHVMYQPMKQYLKIQGKLFRPLLTCICIEGFNQNPDLFKPILAISEIIHSSSLILDDIADASLTRRGHPCSHLIYGIPRAANASCAMTFYAFRLLETCSEQLDLEMKIRLYETLIWENYVTNIGSALDLGWVLEKCNEISEQEYIQHILFRSCSYTYRHAARIGAIVAGADSRNLEIIFHYSTLLGIAFQLIDDILNLKPLSGGWGKTIAEDLTEGKRSLLVLYCLQKSSKNDRERLLHILNGKHIEIEILDEAIGILEKYKCFEYVSKKAEGYIEEACKTLQDSDLLDDYKSLLKDFAYYVIERKI